MRVTHGLAATPDADAGDCRCQLTLYLPTAPVAVNCRCAWFWSLATGPAPVFPPPAFGSASRPRSVHFPQGRHFGNWEIFALEGNDLGGLRLEPRLDC